ncbi:family 20 glycosylhydrolase [Kitasatospora sp. Root107]|uniref:family 20 glycosylhydrolase n=1 Tax=Kitasatospora sp. Root107 TaxID=1736424 RepID=UPI000A3FA43B|nr:family 20 glycosylhydrolase [Kitasatospora sp. Root107]
MRLLRLLTAVLCTVAALALPGLAVAPAQAAAGPPQTVPALRQWTAGTGSFTFTAGRIVVDPAYSAQLADEAGTFAEDLRDLTGRTVPVVNGSPVAGDIALTLGDAALPTEGYRMTVSQSVTLQGATDAGVFNGTRTVLQLLRQSATVPAGTAVDWPTKAERGLMIDQGRKFFTVPWIEQHIKELAYLKLNYFHFHLSDTYGFRLESSTHPEIVSTDHYTKQDIAALVALGQKYHVTIVPEIDTPGHMNAILAAHPELKLKNSSGTASPDFIDLSLPGSYTLIKDLIQEYLPLFPAPYWHIGADEYVTDYAKYPQLLSYARAHYGANATAKDTYYGFVNWSNALVRAAGKTTRMWNDGIKAGDGTIQPDRNILVEYWYSYGLTPQQLADAGHVVANESWTPTYYVLGGAKPDTRWMYESWQPDLFQGNSTLADPSRNPGSLIHVWCDNPTAETESQIAAGIMYPLRALAQQTWGSPKPAATYASFTPIVAAVGHHPGWPSTAQPGDLAHNRPTTASSTETAAFPAAFATDGDQGTRWASAYADPQWIQVDLGSPQTVNRVVLRWEAAYGKAFQIQLSDDAVTWRTVHSTTAGTGGVQELTGLTGSGRYIRMYGTQRGTGYGYSLYEFEVYGGQLSGTRTLTVNGKALDDPASSMTSGTQLITWQPHGGRNQQWQLTAYPDGSYTMVNGVSGLCADVAAGTANAAVVQATCTGGDSQRWLITATGSGYTVANRQSTLLLTTAATTDGAPVTQQPAGGSALQLWQIS